MSGAAPGARRKEAGMVTGVTGWPEMDRGISTEPQTPWSLFSNLVAAPYPDGDIIVFQIQGDLIVHRAGVW